MIYDGPFIPAQEIYAHNRAVLIYSRAAHLAHGALHRVTSSRTIRTIAVAATFGASLVTSGCATELAPGEREDYTIESAPLPPPCTITITAPEGAALRSSPYIYGAGGAEVDNKVGTAIFGAQLDSYGNTAQGDLGEWFDVTEDVPSMGLTTLWVSTTVADRVCNTSTPSSDE